MQRLLLIDDNPDLARALGAALAADGWDVVAEARWDAALRRAALEPFDVLACGAQVDGRPAERLLQAVRDDGSDVPLLVCATAGREPQALAALAAGAFDWVAVPAAAEVLRHAVRQAAEHARLRGEVAQLRCALGPALVRDVFIAESRQLRDLVELASRIARLRGPVLLTGEPGTGKEALARAVHRMSPRADGPFLVVQGAALPGPMLAAELFGDATGRAGLLEAAHGGTLLLDGVHAIPEAVQARLLQFLEDGRVGAGTATRTVDVRLVAASPEPLGAAVGDGRFRAELYLHFEAAHLHLPPLRERPDDILALAAHFARQAERQTGHSVRFTTAAVERLTLHPWPGNVRELRHVVERAVMLGSEVPIGADAVLPGAVPAADAPPAVDGSLDLRRHVAGVERELIRRALEQARGSRREAADLLGVSLRTLFYKMRRYRLDRTAPRDPSDAG